LKERQIGDGHTACSEDSEGSECNPPEGTMVRLWGLKKY